MLEEGFLLPMERVPEAILIGKVLSNFCWFHGIFLLARLVCFLSSFSKRLPENYHFLTHK